MVGVGCIGLRASGPRKSAACLRIACGETTPPRSIGRGGARMRVNGGHGVVKASTETFALVAEAFFVPRTFIVIVCGPAPNPENTFAVFHLAVDA